MGPYMEFADKHYPYVHPGRHHPIWDNKGATDATRDPETTNNLGGSK
jgi:hypothetical protein